MALCQHISSMKLIFLIFLKFVTVNRLVKKSLVIRVQIKKDTKAISTFKSNATMM